MAKAEAQATRQEKGEGEGEGERGGDENDEQEFSPSLTMEKPCGT